MAKKTVTIYIDEHLWEELKECAKSQYRSTSAVAKLAIIDYLRQQGDGDESD